MSTSSGKCPAATWARACAGVGRPGGIAGHHRDFPEKQLVHRQADVLPRRGGREKQQRPPLRTRSTPARMAGGRTRGDHHQVKGLGGRLACIHVKHGVRPVLGGQGEARARSDRIRLTKAAPPTRVKKPNTCPMKPRPMMCTRMPGGKPRPPQRLDDASGGFRPVWPAAKDTGGGSGSVSWRTLWRAHHRRTRPCRPAAGRSAPDAAMDEVAPAAHFAFHARGVVVDKDPLARRQTGNAGPKVPPLRRRVRGQRRRAPFAPRTSP